MSPILPNRRQVLAAGAAACAAPLVLARRSLAFGVGRPRSLVLVELSGGLDVLNALVPYEDDVYYRSRPSLAVPKGDVLRIDDHLGFVPELSGLRSLLDEGRLSIVQSVGRPGATMSHFKELNAWHEATGDGLPANEGWIGRLRKVAWSDEARPEHVTHVGSDPPRSLRSREHRPLVFASPESFAWSGAEREGSEPDEGPREERGMRPDGSEGGGDPREVPLERVRRTLEISRSLAACVRSTAAGYRTDVEYPRGAFAASLRTIAALLDAGFGTRVYSVRQGSYDAHSTGCGCTADSLLELSGGLTAFQADLARSSAARDVLVLCYSEFGRRVAENSAGGTDHGAAGPIWLLGPGLRPGLQGPRPSLSDLDENGNLRHHVDFRAVLGAVLDGWFGVPHERILGRSFEAPPLIQA